LRTVAKGRRGRTIVPILPARREWSLSAPARRLTSEAIQRGEAVISVKPYLGPERIAWDLQNGGHLTISPATIKRLKRKLHEATCPPPPPPVWRSYARHHPHSLWHGDFLEKACFNSAHLLKGSGERIDKAWKVSHFLVDASCQPAYTRVDSPCPQRFYLTSRAGLPG
jgi:hypothetical protein